MTATRGTDLAVTGTAIIMITIARLAGDLPALAEFMLLWGGLGCLAAYWTWRWLEFTTPSDGPRFVSLSFAGAWLYSFAGERLQAGIRTGARNHDQSPAQYAADLIRHAAADGRCKLYARAREDGPMRRVPPAAIRPASTQPRAAAPAADTPEKAAPDALPETQADTPPATPETTPENPQQAAAATTATGAAGEQYILRTDLRRLQKYHEMTE